MPVSLQVPVKIAFAALPHIKACCGLLILSQMQSMHTDSVNDLHAQLEKKARGILLLRIGGSPLIFNIVTV